MKFNTLVIDLGKLNESKSYSAFFSYTGEPVHLVLSSSCGCTNVTWDKENHAVKFTVNTGKIPHHLQDVGKYNLNKTITVIETENAQQRYVLTIKGEVYK